MKPYPEYKDSGVEWIGEIPVGWDIKPLFLCYSENKKKNDGSVNTVLSLSYGKLIKRDVETNQGLLPESFDTYQQLNVECIALRMTDLQNDKRSLRVGFCEFEGIITSAYIGLKPARDIYSKFFYYYLHACDLKKVFYSLGGGLRQTINYNDFKKFPLVLPCLSQQTQIANYLDTKTKQIDDLISKEQRKIELLKEYRQSLISDAVTGKIDVREAV